VLAAAGVQLLPGMIAGQVANLLWGCAVAGVHHEQLLSAAVTRLTRQQQPQQPQQQQPQQQQQQRGGSLLAAASAADVATIAWSLCKLQVWQPAVFEACAQHFLAQTQQYGPADAADLAWALAWHCPPTVAAPAQQQQHLQSDAGPAAASSNSADSSADSSGSSGGTGATTDGSVALQEVLAQLLRVCESDVDSLSPQQLTSVGLVTAALQAGCVPVNTGCLSGHRQTCSSSGSGGSSASTGGSSSVDGSTGSFSRELWSNVASWGPAPFTAADGVQLLWAHLLTAGQGQQQQQQQQGGDAQAWEAAGMSASAAVAAKLLASGAVRGRLAAVC
jgi:hypothetical protein